MAALDASSSVEPSIFKPRRLSFNDDGRTSTLGRSFPGVGVRCEAIKIKQKSDCGEPNFLSVWLHNL